MAPHHGPSVPPTMRTAGHRLSSTLASQPGTNALRIASPCDQWCLLRCPVPELTQIIRVGTRPGLLTAEAHVTTKVTELDNPGPQDEHREACLPRAAATRSANSGVTMGRTVRREPARRRLRARLSKGSRTVGNPSHGHPDSGEVVFLCIASARRELPLPPQTGSSAKSTLRDGAKPRAHSAAVNSASREDGARRVIRHGG
jgi:hypothetical protein